ncbi:MAG: hypothetical protein K6F88_05410 [Ruminococcus sp.]|nr:hypothetical protein [Ruminococcus sp.]
MEIYMKKFCAQCGAELTENGICPNCSQEQEEPKANETAPETIETTEETKPETPVEPESAEEQPQEEPANPEAEESAPETEAQTEEPATEAPEAEAQTEEPAAAPETFEYTQQPEAPRNTVEVPAADVEDVRPSKFYYAFRQVGNVLKHFFSKHTIDAISAQYSEILPIWVILLPVSAIISALSMTLSFDGTHGLSIGAGSLFSGMKLSGLEVFLISFAMSVAVEFVYSIAVMVFFRLFKIKTKFKAAANLTMSAYIAVTIVDLFNIITIGAFKSESTVLSSFGMIAFILLLYIGIINILRDKKPFWSFFLTMVCASLAALVAALVVTCPIIVMRGLQELANTTVAF